MPKYIKTRGLSSRVMSMFKYSRFTRDRRFWALKAQKLLPFYRLAGGYAYLLADGEPYYLEA